MAKKKDWIDHIIEHFHVCGWLYYIGGIILIIAANAYLDFFYYA